MVGVPDPEPRAVLTRSRSNDQGTIGALQFGGQRCYSLELPWRFNLRRLSRIPAGEYRATLHRSPKFGRVFALAEVPDRDAILIHAANLAGDVRLGWDTQLQGCIAPCERIGAMINSHGRPQLAGLVSRPALVRLMTWAAGKPFTLEIRE